MKTVRSFFTFATFLCAANLFAQTNPTPAIVHAPEAALIPATRDAPTNWMSRHEGFVQEARKGGIDILFLGDSITDGWRGNGRVVWNKYYAPRHAANFGIGGDRTQHVLWRIEHGELDGIHPKVVVLMIGTNNNKDDPADDIAQAIKLIIDDIHAKIPGTKILLLAIFPRGALNDPQRAQVALINTLIAKLDDGATVKFLDIGPKFLDFDGTLPRSIMPDLLHPNAQGYQIWADAMEPTLAEMLK